MLYHKTYNSGKTNEWVAFIHGAGGSSSIWFKQIRALKPHFNLLLIDLRGHGKSSDIYKAFTGNKYTFNQVSRDVIEVLDFLKIQKVHLVGISLGTILIREIAEMQPHRIQSMVLAGAITRLNLRSRFLVKVGNLLKPFMPFMWLYKLFAHIIMPKRNHKEARSLFIREAKKLYQREVNRWFKMLGELNPLLKYFDKRQVAIPTLYVMGDEDHLFLGPVRQIISKNKEAVLKVVENCGHVVNVDQPDIFNHLTIDFIYKNGLNPAQGQAFA